MMIMTTTKAYACESCAGATCTCGCQSAQKDRRQGCRCGEICACGSECTCSR
jgi:hypothetical protein